MPGSFFNRLSNSLFGREPGQRIFFMHVPKCGGTSVDRAIRALYQKLDVRQDTAIARIDSKRAAKVSSIFDSYDYTYGCVDDYALLRLREKYLAYEFCREKAKYISGHVPWNRELWERFSGEIAFVTVLRDPVKKWLSNFYYRKYRGSDRWVIDEELPEYLDSDRGRMHGYDYVKYYGGAREDGDYTGREAIENAKRNLAGFRLVGVLENLAPFVEGFRELTGRTLKVRHLNRSPEKAGRSAEFEKSVEDDIRRVCGPDLEVYRYAAENLVGARAVDREG